MKDRTKENLFHLLCIVYGATLVGTIYVGILLKDVFPSRSETGMGAGDGFLVATIIGVVLSFIVNFWIRNADDRDGEKASAIAIQSALVCSLIVGWCYWIPSILPQ